MSLVIGHKKLCRCRCALKNVQHLEEDDEEEGKSKKDKKKEKKGKKEEKKEKKEDKKEKKKEKKKEEKEEKKEKKDKKKKEESEEEEEVKPKKEKKSKKGKKDKKEKEESEEEKEEKAPQKNAEPEEEVGVGLQRSHEISQKIHDVQDDDEMVVKSAADGNLSEQVNFLRNFTSHRHFSPRVKLTFLTDTCQYPVII